MTQHELIIKYIEAKGCIIPAKLNDNDRRFMNDWIGSQADKRCREMRGMIQGEWKNPYKKQMLNSEPDGKFTRFFLIAPVASNPAPERAYTRPDHTCYSDCEKNDHKPWDTKTTFGEPKTIQAKQFLTRWQPKEEKKTNQLTLI